MKVEKDVIKKYIKMFRGDKDIEVRKSEIEYKITRAVELGGIIEKGDSLTIRYYYTNYVIKDNKVIDMYEDKTMAAYVVQPWKKRNHYFKYHQSIY